jgi:ABC-type uncharacterized transport system ATPase subunit
MSSVQAEAKKPKRLFRLPSETGIAVSVLFLLGVGSLMTPDFLTFSNMAVLLLNGAVIGFLCLGQAREMPDSVKRIAVSRQIGVVLVSHKFDDRTAGLVNWRVASNSARQTLARIRTRGELENPVKALSGNQQKVLFGRITEQDARLILLDEPTKGVDIGAKSEIYDIIFELADQGRCMVVVSSEEE